MEPISILVVDDDHAVGRFVCEVLESAGFEVHSADNLARATEVAGTKKVDVLLSDIVLGPLDGLDVEEVVKAIQPEVKTLFMSGYARPRYKTGAEDPVLVKPFGPDELLERVNALVAA